MGMGDAYIRGGEERGGGTFEAERVQRVGGRQRCCGRAHRGAGSSPLSYSKEGFGGRGGERGGGGVPRASHPPRAPRFGFARGESGAGPGALPLPLPLFRVPIKYALPPPDCGTASGATPLNCHYQHRYGFIS